jgi:predicted Zn-dependent protease
MTACHEESDQSRSLQRTLARSALMFEADILDQLVEREPENVAYLAALGQAFSKLKKHKRGLAVDRQLVVTRPGDPTFRYNLACSLVLTGDLIGACRELLKAIDLGYRDFDHLYRDSDLTILRADDCFTRIKRCIAKVESQSA